MNLHNYFEYDGTELWRNGYTDSKGRKYPKKIVKSTPNDAYGYCTVSVNGKTLKYHRIIWILNYGTISREMQIDHINGDRSDNRLENLRLVTNRQNQQNRDIHRNGKLVGAVFHKQTKKWNAQTMINGKSMSLGYFDTEREAHAKYVKYHMTNNINHDILTHRLSQKNVPAFFQIVEES